MPKPTGLILDFTHTYAKTWMERFPGLACLDCSDIEGTDMYCAQQAQGELERRLRAYPVEGIHFLDSGNYHYLTRLFAGRIGMPYHLVLLDNHSDMQPSMIPELLSCGAWAKQLLAEDPHLEQMLLIGPPQCALDEIEADKIEKLLCVSREEWQASGIPGLCRKLEKAGASRPPFGSLPLYFSIDKDVLSETYARTNWDQGEMTLPELKAILQCLAQGRRVIGADICGELPVAPPHEAAAAQRTNETANEALYELFLSYF